MKIEPYIDPNGIAQERERAAYEPALIVDNDRYVIGFLPQGEGLTCLEFVAVFGIALRPETGPEAVGAIMEMLRRHAVGLDAVYFNPDRPKPPTYPNIVSLRAA